MKGLDRYQLMEEVGHGGMSTVWRAIDSSLGREVAVKVLHPHLASDDESIRRFQREAHAVAKLHHPNILEIYDYSGNGADGNFIVTEFIRGRTLKQFLADHPIAVPEAAAAIVMEVGRALSHAHSVGVIHRDIKPENVMIRQDGVLKLMDFGIAQMIDLQRLTVTGELLGSPAYMAPEQVDGRPLDFRTDVFSLGTLLYQLTTAELPFRGRNPHEVLKRISEGFFLDPTLVTPRVDDRVASIIRRALARSPDDRYPDVTAMMADLRAYLEAAELRVDGAEARAFVEAPEAWQAAATPRIVAALARSGREALARGEIPAALALFSRALCRDPKNTEILALLDRLSRRRRRARVLYATVALALIVAAGAAAVRFWPAPRLARAPATAAMVGPRPGPSGGKRMELPAPSRGESPLSPSSPKGEPAAEPRSTTPTRRATGAYFAGPGEREIEIVPSIRAVRMTLDGHPLGWYGSPATTITVGSGSHTLVLDCVDDLCLREKIAIPAGDPRTRIAVPLTWKPARITFTTNAPDAEVIVAGRIYRPGEPIDVPLRGREPKSEIPVVVQASGYEMQAVRVAIEAGKTMPAVKVELARGAR
ncbi:MAG: serine/threonine-protein kinase [Myxococcota bacterium]